MATNRRRRYPESWPWTEPGVAATRGRLGNEPEKRLMKNNVPAADPLRRSADELCDELRELVAQAEGMLKNAASPLSADALGSLRARCDASKVRLGALCAEAANQCAKGVEKFEARLQAKPYRSLALAAGVALAVGLLAYRGGRKSAARAVSP